MLLYPVAHARADQIPISSDACCARSRVMRSPEGQVFVPLVLLAYLAFMSISLPDHVGNVAWPSVRVAVGQPLAALGVLVVVGVAGYVVSSSLAAFLLARLGIGRLLTWSTALSAAGLMAYASARAFWVVLLAVFGAGVTSGAIDSALNGYAARHFGVRHISWMHAWFCLGAMVGPAAFVLLLGHGVGWRWVYAGLAGVQGLLALAFALTSGRWATPPRGVAEAERPTDPTLRLRLRSCALLPSLTTYALQSGIEASTSIWAYVYLTEGRGVSSGIAGLAVSAFWAMMLVGRLVVGHWADQFGVSRFLGFGVLGMLLSSVIVAAPGPAWLGAIGVAAVGFAAAPMFPLLTLTTAERVGAGAADRTVGLQFATSAVAGAVVPGITVGSLAAVFGPQVVGPFLVGLAAAMCLAHRGLSSLRRAHPHDGLSSPRSRPRASSR
ncbi:MAG TPA: MFS transporter [Actinopolymorphaceae bacterium]